MFKKMTALRKCLFSLTDGSHYMVNKCQSLHFLFRHLKRCLVMMASNFMIIHLATGQKVVKTCRQESHIMSVVCPSNSPDLKAV